VKRLWKIVLAAGAFIVLLALVAVLVVQTTWFRNYVKQTIITSIADSTGGRVDAGSFQFDWRHLRAVLTDLVVHGTEPSGSAPLTRVARVQVDLRLLTSLRDWWNIGTLILTEPQANVIVYPNGSTNIPRPRKPAPNESALESVVDLAIGHFEINNGRVTLAAHNYDVTVSGNNLRAKLTYNLLSDEYRGQISLQPLYVVSGRNSPINLTVSVPVLLARNKIEISGARITSPLSALAIDVSLKEFQNASISAHVNGHIALADLPIPAIPSKLPPVLYLDAKATNLVANLHLALGRSNLDASGTLDRGLTFKSHLSLKELAGVAGELAFNGNAQLDARNNMAFNGLQIAGLGAEFSGDASLQNFSRYQLHGNLRHLDLQNAFRAAANQSLPYDGVISGPLNVEGTLNAPFFRKLTAQAQLSITPAAHGIPVSGRLNATYSGAHDALTIQHSLLTLPHSRLTIDGSPGKQLNVALTTTNLDDLLAAVPSSSRLKVSLNGGQASFTGSISGPLTAPRIAGHAIANRLTIAGRQFDSVVADGAISKSGLAIQNGSLTRNAMQAHFAGSLGLLNWEAPPNAPISAVASIQNGDLADLLALAGQPSAGYSGQLTANLNINGTLGNPGGSGTLTVLGGSIDNQPFDRAEAQVNFADQLVTIPTASIQAGAVRVNLTAQYQHPRDNFSTGQLHANIQSTQVDLAQLTALQKQRPHTSGLVQLNASIAGDISNQFRLTNLSGNASVRDLQSEGQTYGDLTATSNTNGQTVTYSLASNFAGSNINVSGETQLAPDYPTTARATLANLPIERVLALAHRTDIAVKGSLSGTASFNGTRAHPQGSADFNLAKATIYDDEVDHLHARLNYYDHPTGNVQSGNLQFHIDSSNVNLARVKTITRQIPGLGGTLQIDVNGAAQIRSSDPRVLFTDLNGNLKATGLAAHGQILGDLTLSANTASGRVNLTLDSKLAGASIQGHGAVQLAATYPATAQLTFKNATSPALGIAPQGFEIAADGEASLNGPLTNPQQLRASFQLSRLQMSSNSSLLRKTGPVLLQNQGPISASLDGGIIRIQSAHLTGPETNLEASGSLPLNGQALNVAVKGNMDLAVLEKLDSAITSSGGVELAATIRGTVTQPFLGGQLELRNSSFDYSGMPTGIWKANGIVLLNGDSAVIRNLTAEAGGGKITVTGSATMNGALRFGLQARASRVRLQIQPGLSTIVSANVSASGTTANSTLAGAVTLDQVSYASHSDLGSILSLAAPPVQAAAPSQFLQDVHLDLRVRSSSALAVQSSLAQNIQLDADVRIRGTVANPGVLGRVNITEGKLTFFGSTYTVNSGNISFFNPIRVEPILDLSLETQTQGVDVVLKVTGPIDNMKLSYTSDPPLQFQEIVSLLAAGTTPTSDPTLLANQPSLAAQSFQQMGESAIVGKALADPVSNQLQRVFGVTQLKINPTFASGSQLPATQLSLQQQISNNLSFTYVTGLNTANAETIQVQWTFTPQWSAQALRDYNGIFSVTLTYKMQLR